MSKPQMHVTPTGAVKYAYLLQPSTKFKPEGEYSVSLVLEGQDAADTQAVIDEAIVANIEEVRKTKTGRIKENATPYEPEYDANGKETGATVFKFKQTASAKSRDGSKTYNFVVPIFDAAKKVIHPDSIGRGTLLKVAYEIHPYYVASTGAGVSLRLKAVQVIELQTFNSDFGFEATAGYVAEDAAPEFADESETPAGDF